MGNTKVIAAVLGPREVQYKNQLIYDQVLIIGVPKFKIGNTDTSVLKPHNDKKVHNLELEKTSLLGGCLTSELCSYTIHTNQERRNLKGIVPKAAPRTNQYEMPCQVHIFARLEDFEVVKLAISDGGFQLLSENNLTSSTMKQKREAQGGISVDEIFKLLEEQIGQSGALGELEPPKDVIKSELFSHQKERLGWLVQRENSCDLPFWEVKDGTYRIVLTNHLTDKRPEPLRGGIFADAMGLGKTLTLLSLIAFDKFCINSPPPVDDANVLR